MKWVTLLSLVWVVLGDTAVFQLHDENFKATISKDKPVLVKFYAPWCFHSQALAPEYEKVAEEVKAKNEPFVIAEIDGYLYKGITANYNVQGFPSIRLFVDGIAINYEGERKANNILEFIREKTKSCSKELKDESAVKEQLKTKGKRCILISDNEEDKKNFLLTAKLLDEFTFFHTSQKIGKQVFGDVQLPCAILLRDFGEKQTTYRGQFDSESLITFLRDHQFDVTEGFNDETVKAILQQAFRKGVLLILPEGEHNEIKEAFKQLANSRKSNELLFIITNIKEHWTKRYIEHHEIKDKQAPFVEIIDNTKGYPKRIEYRGDFSLASLQEFIDKNTQAMIYKYFKTEDIPEDNKGPVYKIVAQTFQKDVLDNEYDVLVKFYTERCAGCKELEIVYDEVGKSVVNSKMLKVVKMNGLKNNVPIYVKSFPVVYLYPANKKDNPIKYEGRINKDELIKFLKENCTHDIDVREYEMKETREQPEKETTKEPMKKNKTQKEYRKDL